MVGGAAVSGQIWLFLFDNFRHVWFGIVMLKVYFAGGQALFNDFRVYLAERGTLWHLLWSFPGAAPAPFWGCKPAFDVGLGLCPGFSHWRLNLKLK